MFDKIIFPGLPSAAIDADLYTGPRIRRNGIDASMFIVDAATGG
jgi:hypothetical protein